MSLQCHIKRARRKKKAFYLVTFWSSLVYNMFSSHWKHLTIEMWYAVSFFLSLFNCMAEVYHSAVSWPWIEYTWSILKPEQMEGFQPNWVKLKRFLVSWLNLFTGRWEKTSLKVNKTCLNTIKYSGSNRVVTVIA